MESGDIRRIPAALAFFAAFYALSPSGKSAHTVPSGSLSLSSGIWIGFHLLITEFSVEPTGCKHRRLNICSFQGHCYCRRRPISLFDDYCGSRPPLLRIKATGC